MNCFSVICSHQHGGVGAGQASPAVLLSLNPCLSLSPTFPSLTCVISFFSSLFSPPLLLTFRPFSPPSCSLHPSHYFGSIHLITLHLLSTLGSPTSSPSFPSIVFISILSVFKILEISSQALRICCLFFLPPHFSPAFLLHFSTAPPPPSSVNFFWLIAPHRKKPIDHLPLCSHFCMTAAGGSPAGMCRTGEEEG